MNSQKPDLDKIVPPRDPPPENPDPKTQAEEREIQKRRLTPTEQLHLYHNSHIQELREDIHFHRNECNLWKKEVDELQESLRSETSATKSLTEQLASIRENSRSTGVLHITANALQAIGALAFGITGAPLGDLAKTVVTTIGATLAVCGFLLGVLAWFNTRREGANNANVVAKKTRDS